MMRLPKKSLVAEFPDRRSFFRFGQLGLVRVVVILTLIFGINYIIWRWCFSLNWNAAWISVPLVVAESYSMIDVCLFGLMMWMARERRAPPAAPEGRSVDIFIATYNEPVEMVVDTARAARDVSYPHKTWILDDGARAEMVHAAAELGVGYISRGSEWAGKPRHAKAGNVNNALMNTDGEFVLILDADQIPRPQILHETLGYFLDEKVALCQTPQVFTNVAFGDPLGSQAPLFYGPIQQGKDGWNAAFFCGSNAILRREALLQLGILSYVQSVESTIGGALRTAARAIRTARHAHGAHEPTVKAALGDVAHALGIARDEVRLKRIPLGEITFELHRQIDAASDALVRNDVAAIADDLAGLDQSIEEPETGQPYDSAAAFLSLSARDLSPLNALESVRSALRTIAIDRPLEAQPVMPLATISVTEDMATSMRLHGLGWKSVYHNELLADGLAPEDVGTMLTQRLRWGQGTMQVFLRENPLVQWKMSLAQRLMYFATMWSYLSGYAAVAYFAAPIVFLLLGILPVSTNAWDFFSRFLPFMICNQLLFFVAARGIPTWRGQQYSLALFPVWIRSCTSAFENVVLKIPLDFAVTPKTKREPTGPQWNLIKPQIVIMVLLVAAIVIGITQLSRGADPLSTGVNVAWAIYDLIVLSVLFGAATFTGYEPWDFWSQTPDLIRDPALDATVGPSFFPSPSRTGDTSQCT